MREGGEVRRRREGGEGGGSGVDNDVDRARLLSGEGGARLLRRGMRDGSEEGGERGRVEGI